MTNYVVTDEELTDVADSIRTKGGTSALLEWPQGYVDAVDAIETGGGATLKTGQSTARPLAANNINFYVEGEPKCFAILLDTSTLAISTTRYITSIYWFNNTRYCSYCYKNSSGTAYSSKTTLGAATAVYDYNDGNPIIRITIPTSSVYGSLITNNMYRMFYLYEE